MDKRKYLHEVRPLFAVGGKVLDVDASYRRNRESNTRHLAIAQNLMQNPNIINVAKAAYHAYRGSQLGLPFSGKPERYNPINTGVAPTPTSITRTAGQSMAIFEEYAKRDKNFLSKVTSKYINDNNLQTFSGIDGKRYIKTADGKVKALNKLGRELLEGENRGDYWKLY